MPDCVISLLLRVEAGGAAPHSVKGDAVGHSLKVPSPFGKDKEVRNGNAHEREQSARHNCAEAGHPTFSFRRFATQSGRSEATEQSRLMPRRI